MNFEELQLRAPHGKVKLTIEYDGSRYCGWQRQRSGIPSIQESIEDALQKTFDKKVNLMGASRTDSGVHAMNQTAHFIAPRDVSSFNFVHLFQALLPHDITIKKAEMVPAHFHAQVSTTGKVYIYRIWNQPIPSALQARRSLWIRKPLDLNRLNQGASHLIGTQDFNCFRSEGSPVNSTVRSIYSAKFLKTDDFVEFHIHGGGFLKQMVRNIVGTLLQIELNGRAPDSLPSLIAGKDRRQAGPTVNPNGLYLAQVFYPAWVNEVATEMRPSKTLSLKGLPASSELDKLAQPL